MEKKTENEMETVTTAYNGLSVLGFPYGRAYLLGSI